MMIPNNMQSLFLLQVNDWFSQEKMSGSSVVFWRVPESACGHTVFGTCCFWHYVPVLEKRRV